MDPNGCWKIQCEPLCLWTISYKICANGPGRTRKFLWKCILLGYPVRWPSTLDLLLTLSKNIGVICKHALVLFKNSVWSAAFLYSSPNWAHSKLAFFDFSMAIFASSKDSSTSLAIIWSWSSSFLFWLWRAVFWVVNKVACSFASANEPWARVVKKNLIS